jgi:cytidylate kinase
MIITIDGPAGSGKSTVARRLGGTLGLKYLDTGAMYRAIAYTALQTGVDFADDKALVALTESIHLEVECGPAFTRVRVDGRDVSEAIRSMDVSRNTSFVAKCQPIRTLLVEHQRILGAKLGSFVSEGRDQGSIVFPNADTKFVLEASIETRAERRYRELLADGQDVDIALVIENLEARDALDARQWEPLLASDAAVVIDTTALTLTQVIDSMIEIIRAN